MFQSMRCKMNSAKKSLESVVRKVGKGYPVMAWKEQDQAHIIFNEHTGGAVKSFEQNDFYLLDNLQYWKLKSLPGNEMKGTKPGTHLQWTASTMWQNALLYPSTVHGHSCR